MPEIDIDGLDVHYEEHGEGDPLILIHQAHSDSRLWKNQVDALSDEYRVITYDIRGHGRTGGSDTDVYSVDLFANDLRQLITALNIERPIICGSSLGGMIALQYAATYPDDISALIVAGTTPPESKTPPSSLQRFIARAAPIFIRVVGYQRSISLLNSIAQLLGGDTAGDQERKDRLRGDQTYEKTAQEFSKVFNATLNFHEASVDLPNISAPTLALFGEYEAEMFAEARECLEQGIEDLRVEIIPEAGHTSHVDNPDEFTDIVREFAHKKDTPETQ